MKVDTQSSSNDNEPRGKLAAAVVPILTKATVFVLSKPFEKERVRIHRRVMVRRDIMSYAKQEPGILVEERVPGLATGSVVRGLNELGERRRKCW